MICFVHSQCYFVASLRPATFTIFLALLLSQTNSDFGKYKRRQGPSHCSSYDIIFSPYDVFTKNVECNNIRSGIDRKTINTKVINAE